MKQKENKKKLCKNEHRKIVARAKIERDEKRARERERPSERRRGRVQRKMT